jgi:hypothetical protein
MRLSRRRWRVYFVEDGERDIGASLRGVSFAAVDVEAHDAASIALDANARAAGRGRRRRQMIGARTGWWRGREIGAWAGDGERRRAIGARTSRWRSRLRGGRGRENQRESRADNCRGREGCHEELHCRAACCGDEAEYYPHGQCSLNEAVQVQFSAIS